MDGKDVEDGKDAEASRVEGVLQGLYKKYKMMESRNSSKDQRSKTCREVSTTHGSKQGDNDNSKDYSQNGATKDKRPPNKRESRLRDKTKS